ncbi:hemerythrin domain-containing protein [Angustibacter luteus]|uniref:Hemerythrin domain-containing protein n=1 Tax=Angustibacter luteus TaxID=658456 RepID=A0ABW1JDK6_9ACTN
MTAIDTTERPDTRDMVTVHRFLRREFRLAPGLVERVAAGDVQRAALVGQHLDFMSEFLHHHHSAEDEVLWPVLVERVPDELAPLVELMEAQHERVDELLQQINALVPPWTRTASATDRDRLAALLAELYVGLHEHMEAEETRILPLAASCLTVAEWKRVGEVATGEHPKRQLPLILGMIEYEGDPEVVAELVANAPRLLRLIVPPLSKRAFRKYALALHGTTTP